MVNQMNNPTDEKTMFKGSIVALVTPFLNGKIDEAAFKSLLNWHIEEGTSAIVVCGSTGESMTMSQEEQAHLIKIAKETIKGKVPLIAGTSAIGTQQTIALTQQAEELGADAALIVVPPYIKPSKAGIYQHYANVAASVTLPIILYNNPARSVVNLEVDTIVELAKIPNIVGLKDSSPDLSRTTLLRRLLGPKFSLLSGEDGSAAAYLAQGGDGWISVTANVAPRLCAKMQKAWMERNLDDFATYRDQLDQLIRVLFLETNPCPVKYAVSVLGKCQPHLRAPLQVVNESTQGQIKTVMKNLGLVA